jgi:mono/diheme cytochrome c family protein
MKMRTPALILLSAVTLAAATIYAQEQTTAPPEAPAVQEPAPAPAPAQEPAPALAPAAAAGRTTADGIGTDAQVKRGNDVYQMMCASCHDAQLAGSGTAPALAGADFEANWKNENVASLFERIRQTMPADNPGALSGTQTSDIIAFILNFNRYPLADQDLPTEVEALKTIKITGPK